MNLVMVEIIGILAVTSRSFVERGLHIINEGRNTEDLNRVIEDGPGIRWSLIQGTFLLFI